MPEKENPFKKHHVLSGTALPSAKKNVKLEDTELFQASRELNYEYKNKHNKDTMDTKTTVDITKVSDDAPPVNNTQLNRITSALTPHQQSVYFCLYRLAETSPDNTTSCIGYSALAKHCNISFKTVQRSVDFLCKEKYIERIDHHNTRNDKGSIYKIHTMATPSTVDPRATVDISNDHRSPRDHRGHQAYGGLKDQGVVSSKKHQ